MGEEYQESESSTVARAEDRKETGRQVSTSNQLIQYCMAWESEYPWLVANKENGRVELKNRRITLELCRVFIIAFLSSVPL